MEKIYDDIIDLEHPGLFGRTRMSLEQRAAQFSPFAALSGYGDLLKETARLTSVRPVLDKDAQCELDATIAVLLKESQEKEVLVEVERFLQDAVKEGGEIIRIRGCLKEVDQTGRKLILKDIEPISMDDILSLRRAPESGQIDLQAQNVSDQGHSFSTPPLRWTQPF